MKKIDTIGTRIAEARKALGYTQADVADKMRVTFQAVSSWERDEFVPDTSSKFIKKYYKNVEEVIIPDLGHLMLKSINYRLIINAIKDFLDE